MKIRKKAFAYTLKIIWLFRCTNHINLYFSEPVRLHPVLNLLKASISSQKCMYDGICFSIHEYCVTGYDKCLYFIVQLLRCSVGNSEQKEPHCHCKNSENGHSQCSHKFNTRLFPKKIKEIISGCK